MELPKVTFLIIPNRFVCFSFRNFFDTTNESSINGGDLGFMRQSNAEISL